MQALESDRAIPQPIARRAWAWLVSGPTYAATDADLRTIDLVGLRVPVRATVAISLVTLVLLLDYTRTFLPDDLVAQGRTPGALWAIALERTVLFGLLPLAVVVLGFRDDVRRYGLQIGDRLAGAVLVLIGLAVMTPIVLWFATLPDVRAFYAPSAAPLPTLLATHVLDLTSAEFLFRGFLMFTLLRVIGPLGVVVATLPFVFGHLGKPELELLSTLGGGLVYGWLAWRTGSIVWGAAGHVVIMTLVTMAAGAGAAASVGTLAP